MVLVDSNGLTRIGFQGIGFSTEDRLNYRFFQLGFFFCELGFVVVVVVSVVVFFLIGIGEEEVEGVDEEVFEGGLVEERWWVCGSDLETGH